MKKQQDQYFDVENERNKMQTGESPYMQEGWFEKEQDMEMAAHISLLHEECVFGNEFEFQDLQEDLEADSSEKNQLFEESPFIGDYVENDRADFDKHEFMSSGQESVMDSAENCYDEDSGSLFSENEDFSDNLMNKNQIIIERDRMLEFMQHILNITENEDLNVDGELGMSTQEALDRFQIKYRLGKGGATNEETILALVQRGLEVLMQQSLFEKGKMDNNTQKTIVEFKQKCGLEQNFIIDKETMSALINALAIPTTDNEECSEASLPSIAIIKKHIRTGEYMKGPTKKEWLFLHHTAGWHNPSNVIESWEKDKRGPVATEFVIGGQGIKGDDDSQDGKVYQAFPQGGYAWHLGIGNSLLHRNSVGIEVCSFGQLTRDGYYKKTGENKKVWKALVKGKYYTYVGGVVSQEQIIQL
ncbi:MAG: N-acetylmuramoyl-L-alanine amidase, partial [Bacteroidales bacterium]|nr:N-acetylmuramoyl-L-alanine amidase [Bacteroidales bacterium]